MLCCAVLFTVSDAVDVPAPGGAPELDEEDAGGVLCGGILSVFDLRRMGCGLSKEDWIPKEDVSYERRKGSC